MTRPTNFDELFADWIDSGPTTASDGVLDSIVRELPRTAQRTPGIRISRRDRAFWSPLRLGAGFGAAAATLVLAVALWGGGPGPEIGGSPSPTASPSASSSIVGTGPIVGQWRTELPPQAMPTDVTCDVPGDCQIPDPGPWAMQIYGRFMSFVDPGNYYEQQVTEVTETAPGEGTLLFTSQFECFLSTSPDHREGRYRWRRQGDELTFEVIEDDCVDRILILTKSVWHPGAPPRSSPTPTP